jgi:aminoglycoside phosphotransferase (APT) family kinase protein
MTDSSPLTTTSTTSARTPSAEVAIDDALVAALVAAQHPDLAKLPLQVVDAGWDNAMYRLGDALAIRLPRRSASADLIAREQAWLPQLAGRLALPVPAPVRVGRPGEGYPWHWSILPWLHGTPADEAEPDDAAALDLGRFLRSLHVTAPPDAPANPFRGVPLQARAAAVQERMQRLSAKTALPGAQVMRLWQEALAAPLDAAPTWLHGDLHPRNVLMENGRISGVIDWSDMTSGDPATDLAAIWMLFSEPRARAAALDAYGGISDVTLRRAQGWAVLFGVLLLDTGLADNPRNAAIGEKTLRNLAQEC